MLCSTKLSYNFRVKTPFAPHSGGPRSAYDTIYIAILYKYYIYISYSLVIAYTYILCTYLVAIAINDNYYDQMMTTYSYVLLGL